MTRVAVLDDYQNVALTMADWTPVTRQAEVVTYRDHIEEPAALAGRLAGTEVVVLMRERTPVTPALLDRLPDLRLLVTTGRSNASVDVQAATERGVLVSSTDAHRFDTEQLVELTWGLIIAAARGLTTESGAVRTGGWQQSLGTGLAGKQLGLVGLGRIGSAVARVGAAFGMSVVAWSENLTAERAASGGARKVTKSELFRESDVVSVHLRLGERTIGTVGREELCLMKPSAVLVNTARGPLIDEGALVVVLRDGRIRAAALDVFAQEPLPADHPFRSLPNVIATPHIGYVTTGTYEVFFADIVEDISAFLAGRPIRLLSQ